MDCRPVAVDLALQADLEPIANAPSSETVTRETFAAIVPKLVSSWEAEQRRFLQSFLGKFITNVPRGVDILDLAIAVVYTRDCSHREIRRMRYPYLLARFFRPFSSDHGGKFGYSHYAFPAAHRQHRGPYSLEGLQWKQVEVGVKWMRNIVTKLGLNPDTATFADLEQCEARLRCLKCVGAGQECAYTWDAAVSASYSWQKPESTGTRGRY